jgi:hypothetical protein
MNAIQTAVHVSNTLSINNYGDDYKHIDFREAFRLATLGGAEGNLHVVLAHLSVAIWPRELKCWPWALIHKALLGVAYA